MNKFLQKVAKIFLGISMAAGVGVGISAAKGSVKEAAPVQAAGTTVKYTVSSKTAVTTSGTAPTGSSATFSSTANTANQLTYGKQMDLTLTGFDGLKITGLTLSMKSNSSKGKGSMSFKSGSNTICSVSDLAFNNSAWNGAWSTSFVTISWPSTNHNLTETTVGTGESLTFNITNHGSSNSTNSLYCEWIQITYEAAASDYVGSLSVSPSTWTGYDSQTLSVSSFAVSGSKNGTAGAVTSSDYEYKGIGYMSSGNFVARDATFSSGNPTTADTRLAWKAKYPTTSGGSTYAWAYVTLTVSADSVKSLAISGSMTKTIYTQGDSWDPAGFTVNAYYTSDPSTPVDVTSNANLSWSYSPASTASTSTTSVTCTASFGGKSATSSGQSVTINEKTNKGGIVNGEKYVIVWDDGKYLPSANYTSGNPGPLDTYTDAIHNVESNCWTFEAEGNTDDTWNIKSSEGQYLFCTNSATGVRTGTLDTTSNTYDFTVDELESTYAGKTCLTLTVGSSGGNRKLTHYTNNGGNDVRAYTTEQNGTWKLILIPYESPNVLDEELTIDDSEATLAFTVGDIFAFGGTVIASYSSTGDKDVTDDVTFQLGNTDISIGDTITSAMLDSETITSEVIEVAVWYTDENDDSAAGAYNVTVSYAPVTSVVINTSTSEMGKTSNFTFGAQVSPSNANQKVSWSASSNDLTAGSGGDYEFNTSTGYLNVHASDGGTIRITVTTVGKDSSSASKSTYVDVTITGDPVVVVAAALSGYSGKNSNLSYSFSNFTGSLSVTSSETNIVTVGTPTTTTGSSGSGTVQVNFLAAGSSTLTFKNGSDSVATCVVTVTASAVSGVEWISSSNMTVYSGSTALNEAKILSWGPMYEMNNGDSDEITSDYTVQLNGSAYSLGTALPAGTFTVTLTYGGHTTSSSNPVITVVQSLNSINETGWLKVTDDTTFEEGDRIIITSESENKVFGAITGSNKYANEGTASFNNGIATSITNELEFTLEEGSTSGTWKLKTGSSYLAGSETKNTLSLSESGTDVTISITDGDATIDFGSSCKILHNVNSTRFSNYTSSPTAAMLLPQIYRYSSNNIANNESHFTAQSKVVEFAQYMNSQMNASNVCSGTAANLGTAWTNVSTKYNTLFGTGTSLNETELAYAHSMLANASANWDESHDSDEQYCLERALKTYEWCVLKYSGTCTAFMSSVRAVEAPHVTPLVNIIGENTNTVAIIVIISMVSVTAIGGYFFLRKRKENI